MSLNPENEPKVRTEKWYKDKSVIITGFVFTIILSLIVVLTLFMYYRNNSETEATAGEESQTSNNVPGFAEGIETKPVQFEIVAPSSSTKLRFQTLVPLEAETSTLLASGEESEKHIISGNSYKLTTFLTSDSENETQNASTYITLLPVEGGFTPIYQFYVLKDGLYHYVNFLETEKSCLSGVDEIPAPCGTQYIDLGYNTYISITCRAEDGFESVCDDIVEGMKIEQLEGNNEIFQEL